MKTGHTNAIHGCDKVPNPFNHQPIHLNRLLRQFDWGQIVQYFFKSFFHPSSVCKISAALMPTLNYSWHICISIGERSYRYCQQNEAYGLLPVANRKRLFKLIDYFKELAKNEKNLVLFESNSPIQSIVIGINNKTKALATHLVTKGIFVKAILSPTFTKESERLRICLYIFNTEVQIHQPVN